MRPARQVRICCRRFPNGVALAAARHAKRPFALTLGRICPEKGVHLAIEAAKRAGIPLLIAGEVFPYEAHRRYFAEEVQPRLDAAAPLRWPDWPRAQAPPSRRRAMSPRAVAGP